MNRKRVIAVALLVFCLVAVGVFWFAVPVKNPSMSTKELLMEKLSSKVSFESTEDSISLRHACNQKDVSYPPDKTRIVVDKSDFRLYLYSGNVMVKDYPAAIGRDPVNAKEKRDDMRTPEGKYYICDRSANPGQKYMGSRWMRLSYPNKEDAARGLRDGLIGDSEARKIEEAIEAKKIPDQTTALGSGIGIHGGWPSSFGLTVNNWTGGCIGLFNADAEEIYDVVSVGTEVLIRK
jgi:murein L,D-transpeptidase YafK